MWRGMLLSGGVASVLLALWVWNCTGPKPVITATSLRPLTSPGAPYRVEVEIENRWRGDGEVAALVRLRDRVTGRVVQAEHKVRLDGHERALVVAELAAPPGDYIPEVMVTYPPR